ncbi:MAG TPA: hypothetical protein VGF40_03835 [Thermoanaerobaculia bacterium]
MRSRAAAVLLIFLACSALFAQEPVAPRTSGPSPAFNGLPVVVADGDDYVVLWSGWFDSTPRFARIHEPDRVVATGELPLPGFVESAAAGPGGSVLATLRDGAGIRLASIRRDGEVTVSEPLFDSVRAFIAWNGREALVVGTSGEAALTDAGGRVLERGIRLPLPGDNEALAVAARGREFLVAWNDRYRLRTATVSDDGVVNLHGDQGEMGFWHPAAGCHGSTCLILYPHQDRLWGVFVGGAKSGPFLVSSRPASEPVAPAWDGSRFVAVWTDVTAGGDAAAHSTELHMAGIALDGRVTPMESIVRPGRNPDNPDIAASPFGDVLVAWSDIPRCGLGGTEIVARFLPRTADLLLTRGLSAQARPALAVAGGSLLVAWEERSDASRIRARAWPSTTQPLDLPAGPAAARPAVGSDGSGFLVAWNDPDPSDRCRSVIHAAAAGSAEAFAIGGAGSNETALLVLWSGSEYVVLWEQRDPVQITAIRVDRTGRPLDPAPVALTAPEPNPSSFTRLAHTPAGLFRTGDRYLLVWGRTKITDIPWHADPPPEADVRATILGGDLTPLGSPQTLVAWGYDPIATMKGDVVAVLYTTGASHHALRLTPGGTVLSDRDLLERFTISDLVPTPSGFAAAAWSELLSFDDEMSIVARRPIAAGARIAPARGGLAMVWAEGEAVYVAAAPGSRHRTVARP